jgi:hypothetical protein
VSVPTDCNCEKLRTCRYEVVGEYQGELLKPLYSSNFSEDDYSDEEDDYDNDYDWGWNDDEEDVDAAYYEDEDEDDTDSYGFYN